MWHLSPEVLVRTVTGLYERDPRAEVLAAVLDVLQPVRADREAVVSIWWIWTTLGCQL